MSICRQANNAACSTSQAPRCNVLGVGVSAIDMSDAIRVTDQFLRSGGKGYVCITGVHGVTEAQKDPEFRRILNSSLLTTPDGMPMVWMGRIYGFRNMSRVYGPDYMTELCRISVERGYEHFLYGGKPGIADALRDVLVVKFPGLKVVGTYTPPFRPLKDEEESELIAQVAHLRPDVVWVGLSTPKQERFMATYLHKLDVRVMVGVGAAFDVHTGQIHDAPTWIKQAGLQWAHRLAQEPRRLWRRYLINNPLFAWRIVLQLSGLHEYSIKR